MTNQLEIAIALIDAQQKLLALHYNYDGKVPNSHLKRFDRLEKEVIRLTELFWQSQVPIHTINQQYDDRIRKNR
jgi:hypothetical protein